MAFKIAINLEGTDTNPENPKGFACNTDQMSASSTFRLSKSL